MKRHFLLSCILLVNSFVAPAQSIRLIAKSDSSFYSGSYVFGGSTHYGYSFGRALLNAESGDRTGIWGENLQWAPDEELFMSMGINSIRYTYQYDNDGRLTRSYGAGWNGTAWDTGGVTTYHYSNSIWDTTYVDEWIGVGQPLEPMSREIRTYGPDGLLTTELQLWDNVMNAYENDRMVTNTYTAGKLTEVLTTIWDGTAYTPYSLAEYTYSGDNMDTASNAYYSGGWIYTSRGIYIYDGNNDVVVTEIQGWQNNVWETTLRWHMDYDNDHNMLSRLEETLTNGVWENTIALQCTYTSANLIETQAELPWNATSGSFIPQQGSGKIRYYYEEFDPAGVQNNVRHQSALKVYPNPASNTININLNTAQTTPFAITIFDATGKSVRHWNEAPTTFYQKQVDVSNLPSGNYFLRIDNRPQESVQFTIMK